VSDGDEASTMMAATWALREGSATAAAVLPEGSVSRGEMAR
jgi:hypothetical protein